MTKPRTPTGRALLAGIMGVLSAEARQTWVDAILAIEAEALPSVEQLAAAVPERLPTGNPDVDRLRAAWNEGRAAILAALRDELEADHD